MIEIVRFLSGNYQWFFSGLGVLLLGGLVRWLTLRRGTARGNRITTHGNNSPGIVKGNYEVKIDERDKN